nr:hypothetical protein [Bradyrhizobium sp. 164]
MADLKRDMAILATSGPDWAERTKRFAARVPGLDIFSQGLIERLNGGWRITDKGRAVLDVMEARHQAPETRPRQLMSTRPIPQHSRRRFRSRHIRARAAVVAVGRPLATGRGQGLPELALALDPLMVTTIKQ